MVVMGVSGAGKSTIAAALAGEVGGVFIDADDLHPPGNVAKMSAGEPLTDTDRMPWLTAVGEAIAAAVSRGQLPVVACSALRRSYRDLIRAEAPDVFFVQLDGTPDLLARRMSGRSDHFMPPTLLASQLATLEALQPDERGVVVDVEPPSGTVVAAAAAAWARRVRSR